MPPTKRAALTTLTTSVANIYNPPGPEEVRNIHVCNKTANPATFTLYIGLTGGSAAGTEIYFNEPVPAFKALDFPWPHKLGTADFLTGKSDTATALVIEVTTAQVPV